jgi:hypothetical protein
MRDITEHELALITGQAEPSQEELAYYGFDNDDWTRKTRAAFTRGMQDGLDPAERAERAMQWSEVRRQRNEARIEAHRACTRSIWARIARGEIRDPFVETMKFSRPIGRG